MRFDFQERPGDALYIEKIWWTQSAYASSFLSRAVTQWEMVVRHHQGMIQLTMRGPETHATWADCPADAEFVGIQFKLGTFMPRLPTRELVDTATTLPNVTQTSFWLHGTAWQFPTFDTADTFVDRLVRAALLVHDPVVAATLQGDRQARSVRSIQERFMRATGLTQSAVRQIRRAHQAAVYLQQGVSISDTMYDLGYYDQPHLTRALKRFLGQTPAHLACGSQSA